MRVLVTGAAGFIGSNFVRDRLERRPDDHVVAFDLLTYAGNRESLPEEVPFVHGDIADAELVEQTLRDEEIGVVVNFAAESHNSLAVVDPGRFFRTNVLGTQTLLEATRRGDVGRFHHVSTCEVYGDLPLYASTENRREWLHVLDHCRAIELVLDRGEPGETYNVGSGVERSIEEIADAVLEQTGKPASLKTIVPDRPGHDRRYLLDSSKIRKQLGWSETIPWAEGIARTVAWYADHREWWEPLRDRAPVDEAAWT